MLRHVDREKDSKLHLGLFKSYELTGSAFDSLFKRMKSCMDNFKVQRKQRSAVSNRPELAVVFKQYDQLFYGFQKQFYLSAETISWDKVNAVNYEQLPAYPILQKALSGMQMLTDRHQAILNGAAADEISDLELMQSVTESVMLPPELNQQQMQ